MTFDLLWCPACDQIAHPSWFPCCAGSTPQAEPYCQHSPKRRLIHHSHTDQCTSRGPQVHWCPPRTRAEEAWVAQIEQGPLADLDVEDAGGACPCQVYATLSDGRHVYFRERGGSWSLGVGATPDEAIDADLWEGDSDFDGWTPGDLAVLVCRALLAGQRLPPGGLLVTHVEPDGWVAP